MRPSLLNKVQSAICVKCRLPNCTENIDKTLLTTDEDYCLENPKSEELSQIIYNGIVEYAVNEFKIGSITKLMGFRIPHIINSAHINEF